MGSSPTALKYGIPRWGIPYFGAGGRTRTGTMSPSVDFESTTSTNSITPAGVIVVPSLRLYRLLHLLRCPVCALPLRACVAHRPLPLARVAPPATGGASLAPQFHHTGRWCIWYLDSILHSFENSKNYFFVFRKRDTLLQIVLSNSGLSRNLKEQRRWK